MHPKSEIDWNTPDGKGFRRYAIQHYREALKLAGEVLANERYDRTEGYERMIGVFEKIASPLVYLHDTWMLLPPETKARYNPEFQQIKKEADETAKKLLEGIK